MRIFHTRERELVVIIIEPGRSVLEQLVGKHQLPSTAVSSTLPTESRRSCCRQKQDPKDTLPPQQVTGKALLDQNDQPWSGRAARHSSTSEHNVTPRSYRGNLSDEARWLVSTWLIRTIHCPTRSFVRETVFPYTRQFPCRPPRMCLTQCTTL